MALRSKGPFTSDSLNRTIHVAAATARFYTLRSPGTAPGMLGPGALTSTIPPLVSLPEILEAPDLRGLLDRYRTRDASSSDRQLLAQLRSDWQKLADGAASSAAAPSRLEPIVVERGQTTFRIFGVIHGIVGGDDRAYMRFVASGLDGAAHLLVENGIGYYYRQPKNEWIPDFVVLGLARSAWLGFTTAWKAPLVFWDLAMELVRRRTATQHGAFDPAYHGLDPEVRRGLDVEAALPARLEVPLALERFDSHTARAVVDDPVACVPRSLFMAGYAVGVAERDSLSTVDLLVGDLHTTEIAWFLTHREHDEHAMFRWGVAFARLPKGARGIRFAMQKAAHLGAAVLGTLPIIAPAVALAMWLLA